MGDSWLHALTSSRVNSKAIPFHKRRTSLLESTGRDKADAAIESLLNVQEEHDAWKGPSLATPPRRAQSYSDFYHAVTSYPHKERFRDEQRQRNDDKTLEGTHNAELGFDAELSRLQDRLLEESHAAHQAYHEELLLTHNHLENILTSTQSTLSLLASLSGSFKSVETQTDTFRQKCETLIIEQKRLEALADDIDQNARYYTYLEPMTRRLNAPGAANLVRGKDFPEMLSNLDNCLVFMEAHPKHKESATYRSRYRLLLTRALTLTRHYFTNSLGEIAADISKRVASGQLKDFTHSALLYARFRVPAPELKALGLEIQKRAVPTPDDIDAGREPEYLSLMRELYESYSATRGRLMLPLVSRKMAELSSTSQQQDVLDFSKACIGFMRGICLDEYDLWYQWFESDGALYGFLESLMDPMHDHLRPKIIHETKLEKLCDLCAMIQGRYMDLDSDGEDDDVDSQSGVSGPLQNGKPSGRRLDFGSLAQPALEDAQTRLVFLAMSALRDGIENYRPSADDLDWPKRALTSTTNGAKAPVLSGKRDPSAVLATDKISIEPNGQTENDETLFNPATDVSQKTANSHPWHPTLGKAIWLLRRIYRLVNSTVFDDLAHRIVHSTIHSLISASQQVTRKKTVQDGQLFLITHLLQLKQQIVAFDIEFIPSEVEFDFSSMTNTFYELRERGSLWNPVSWVRLVSGTVGGGLLPKVVENMLDAKAELDGRLRTVINDFVNGYADHITAPIESSTVSQAKIKASFDALKAVRIVRGLAEKDVPAIRNKLLEFVDDARTRETLVAAVRDQVVMSYEDFFDTASEGQGRKLSRKGKGREDEVLGPELFGEAMERVFQVGQVIGDNDDDGDMSQ